jgi:hypothetical protein
MTTTPSNIATLNPNGFYFSIAKYPELNYHMQDVNLPSMTLGTAVQASSVHDLKIPGETLEFGSLDVSFLVDGKMDNYIAIHDWMVGLGFPTDNAMFTKLLANPKNDSMYSVASKTTSDCTLTILDGNNLPIRHFTFVDAFPVNLSGISLTSTNTDVRYVVATVTLEYSYYLLS